MIIELASDAGGNVRSLGCPPNDRRRPFGLRKKLAGMRLVWKDLLILKQVQGGAVAPLPVVVLRRSGDLSEAKKTRSHLELGR
jgi:hypothetical protein